MTLAAMMVRSVQARQTNDVYLVGCQHIDLSQPDIRDSLTNIYDLSGAIAHDIAGTESARGHAQVIDEQMGGDAASQVARLLLMASLPEASGAVKGLTKLQIVENLVAPHRSPIEFDDAFEKLRGECWYLHRRENDAWVFAKNENLRKKIEKYAEGAPQPKIDAEMQRRLLAVFEPRRKIAYSEILALPKVEDIKTSAADACCWSSVPTRRCRRRTPSACSTPSCRRTISASSPATAAIWPSWRIAFGASGRSPRCSRRTAATSRPTRRN